MNRPSPAHLFCSRDAEIRTRAKSSQTTRATTTLRPEK